MGKSDEIKNEILRRRVRELMGQGLAVSKIAKLIDQSYAHTKQIVEQERPSLQPEQTLNVYRN